MLAISRVLFKTCIRPIRPSPGVKSSITTRHCWTAASQGGMNKRQSPIDLAAAVEASLPPLKISFENGADRANLSGLNNGHTLHIDCVGKILGKLSGGPVEGSDYTLQQFHFHWGPDIAGHGSEHTINGKFSSAELHFVFKNEKYSTMGDAVKEGDGLAVAGVLIKESENPDCDVMPELFEIVPLLQDNEDKSQLRDSLDLESALPKDRTYFTYLGSLTTPGYNECVTWIVFKDEVGVSSRNMTQLREMKDAVGSEILKNWRAVQDLAGREIQLVKQ